MCGPHQLTPGWPPWCPVRRAHGRLTPCASGIRATYTTTRAASMRSRPVAAPRRRRRRPHSSHTDCHHCHCQLACPVSLHRYHPHHPLTHRLRHACNWCGCAHVLASLITVYRLRLPLARVLVSHGLLRPPPPPPPLPSPPRPPTPPPPPLPLPWVASVSEIPKRALEQDRYVSCEGCLTIISAILSTLKFPHLSMVVASPAIT